MELGCRDIEAELRGARVLLGGRVAKRGELPFQRESLAFERPELLGPCVERLFQLADLLPVLLKSLPNLFLGAGPLAQFVILPLGVLFWALPRWSFSPKREEV